MFDLVPYGRRRYGMRQWPSEVDRLWEQMFRGLTSAPGESELSFPVDVQEDEEAYVIRAELPGMEKEDMGVTYEGNVLTIAAVRQEEETREQGSLVHQERRCGRFARQFFLEDVDSENISARYGQGVLEVKVPKKDAGKRTQDIEIE